MKSERVICFLPFGTPAEKEALRQVREMGFTAVQTYTFWRDYEPVKRGQFEWAETDRVVRAIQEAGLKYVPFLLMGPKYAAPDWWLADPRHVGLRCLEHGKVSPIESIWSPAFREEITRVLEAFAAHYLPWNVLESVQPGIGGDYGEAIFPAVGNWPGDYHTHRGFWCAGDDAVASLRAYLQEKYGSLDALNKAWRSRYGSFEEIRPFLKQYASSRTAYFDLIAWYQDSMTRFSEFWMAECRRIFPNIPAYLCTGGADDEFTSGALFAAQAKAAAKHAGGIRLTNEVNKFYENFRLTAHTHAACNFYGAYLGLEPVGPITAEGVRTRNFGSAVYGNRQMFHYYHNFFDRQDKPLPRSIAAMTETEPLLESAPAEKGIAFFWPVDQGLLEGAMPAEARNALLHIRRHYPVSPVSEQMILDGALEHFGCLIMMGATTTRAEVLLRIAAWVKEKGGRLLATSLCRDLELEPVAEFDALFGILPGSEDAWGHTQVYLEKIPGFEALGKITEFHCEHGWLDLAPETEKIAVGKMRPSQSGTTTHPVSPLFRRTYKDGGHAVHYCGYVNLDLDPQAQFSDPGVTLALLADFCAMSGVEPLGTQKGEIARGRVGGKMLILRDDATVEAQPAR
jgi:hypothetical protein